MNRTYSDRAGAARQAPFLTPAVTPSSRLRPLLATLALVGAWAGAVWLTGSVAFSVAGLRVSSRSTIRPAVLAAVLAASALWGWPPDQRRRYLASVRQRGDRLAPWAAGLVALALAQTAAALGGHVAGGSDSSGYVSQSRRSMPSTRSANDSPPLAAPRGWWWTTGKSRCPGSASLSRCADVSTGRWTRIRAPGHRAVGGL